MPGWPPQIPGYGDALGLGVAGAGRERLWVATVSGREVGLQVMREHLTSLPAERVSVGKATSGGAAPRRRALRP